MQWDARTSIRVGIRDIDHYAIPHASPIDIGAQSVGHLDPAFDGHLDTHSHADSHLDANRDSVASSSHTDAHRYTHADPLSNPAPARNADAHNLPARYAHAHPRRCDSDTFHY